jgi:1,4-dihydroxy-2-naphthoyl-CoA hydrolase
VSSIWQDGKTPQVGPGATPPDTLLASLGMEFTEVGENWLKGRMPVDGRTHQPFGLLHGGASVALAETLASWAGTCAAPAGKACVGQEINAHHVRPVTSGWVYGVATPEALGRTSQVWSVRITDERGKLVCIARMTGAIVDAPGQARS